MQFLIEQARHDLTQGAHPDEAIEMLVHHGLDRERATETIERINQRLLSQQVLFRFLIAGGAVCAAIGGVLVVIGVKEGSYGLLGLAAPMMVLGYNRRMRYWNARKQLIGF